MTEKSNINMEDQKRIDNAVRLGAKKQVQLVKYIYEKLDMEGIKDFGETVIDPWAREWAQKIMKKNGLKPGQADALTALGLYEAVHDHTKICTDRLDMFYTKVHPNHVQCGATYCPVAYQWMEIWPQGAHLLCYLYSHRFDVAFFDELNADLFFSKHGECSVNEPGIPHGEPCVMELETKGNEVTKNDFDAVHSKIKADNGLDVGSGVVVPMKIDNLHDIKVDNKIIEFLNDKKIDYLGYVE